MGCGDEDGPTSPRADLHAVARVLVCSLGPAHDNRRCFFAGRGSHPVQHTPACFPQAGIAAGVLPRGADMALDGAAPSVYRLHIASNRFLWTLRFYDARPSLSGMLPKGIDPIPGPNTQREADMLLMKCFSVCWTPGFFHGCGRGQAAGGTPRSRSAGRKVSRPFPEKRAVFGQVVGQVRHRPGPGGRMRSLLR